jgi:hypothetical protein
MNLFHMPSFASYNASKGILHRTFFFVAYNFCMVFGSVCMVFGAVFEVEVVEEGEKKNPEDARDKAAEKDVEEVMNTCKRAKGVEKEKPEEAGEKFEFVVEEAAEKEKPEEAGEKFEFVVDEAAEKEKPEEAGEKFEFVVAEAAEKEKPEEAGEKFEFVVEEAAEKKKLDEEGPQGVPKPSSCLDAMECCSRPRILLLNPANLRFQRARYLLRTRSSKLGIGWKLDLVL